jgi:hypothetical protein
MKGIRMLRYYFACMVLAGSSLIPGGYAQTNGALPSAEAILDRYVAVSGGQSSYDRVQNETRTMTAQINGAAVSQIVIYRTRAGEFHEIAQGAGGKSELGVNGGVAWSRTGDVAHLLDSGEERAQALQEAEPLLDGHWRRVYKSAETVGTETVQGVPCYVLKVFPFVGEPHTLWYDQKTGLQVKQVSPLPDGGSAELTAKGYLEAEGIKIPRVLEVHMSGAVLTMVLDDVKFNQPIPESMLALPPDIERLMKKRYLAPSQPQ